MKDIIITEKSFKFAKRIYFLYKFLTESKKEFILSKQILRSGTSIGANVEEAISGQSTKDFLSKISISYKEARETMYWLRLLHEIDVLDKKQFISLKTDCEELLKILGSIQKTIKQKMNLTRNS